MSDSNSLSKETTFAEICPIRKMRPLAAGGAADDLTQISVLTLPDAQAFVALYEALNIAREQLENYELVLTGETYNSPIINTALAKARGEDRSHEGK